MDLKIAKNNRDWKAFYKVRDNVEFIKYQKKDLKKAIKKSLYTIVVYQNKSPIAVGRVLGDKKIAYFLKDIAVLKAFQNQGLGTLVVKNLLEMIYEKCAQFAYVGLMSTPNYEQFYEKFGFIKRPTNILGSGMVKYYDRKK